MSRPIRSISARRRVVELLDRPGLGAQDRVAVAADVRERGLAAAGGLGIQRRRRVLGRLDLGVELVAHASHHRMRMSDDEHQIGYKVLPRGTPF